MEFDIRTLFKRTKYLMFIILNKINVQTSFNIKFSSLSNSSTSSKAIIDQ